ARARAAEGHNLVARAGALLPVGSRGRDVDGYLVAGAQALAIGVQALHDLGHLAVGSARLDPHVHWGLALAVEHLHRFEWALRLEGAVGHLHHVLMALHPDVRVGAHPNLHITLAGVEYHLDLVRDHVRRGVAWRGGYRGDGAGHGLAGEGVQG